MLVSVHLALWKMKRMGRLVDFLKGEEYGKR
jgi:hypothetical protein